MPRDTLQRIDLFNDRPMAGDSEAALESRLVDRVRLAVNRVERVTQTLEAGSADRETDVTADSAAEYPDLMRHVSVLATIGAALALGRTGHAARRAALTLDLYQFGLPESQRSRIIAHAEHPQRPVWLASGVRDRRLAYWMYATSRLLIENDARGRVFSDDLAEALRIPLTEMRLLKQTLPLSAPAG